MDGADEARERAVLLLEEHPGVDSQLAAHAIVDNAIAVVDPEGVRQRWFVPVVLHDTSGDRDDDGNSGDSDSSELQPVLVGFFVLGLDLVVHRWSSFQRRAGSLDGCPPAATWLDPATIASRARTVTATEPTGPPMLSYDGAPERLAWAVPCGSTTVYVAGDAAWAR